MAVAFDAVGPSSAGATSSASTTLSWTHTCVGNGVALVAACAISIPNDAGFAMTAKLDPAGANTTIPLLGAEIHSGSSTAGFVQLFGLPNVSSGDHTITVTVTGGTPLNLEGGSVSYTGAGTSNPFGAQQSFTVQGTAAPSITHTGSTSGNMISAGLAHGNTITSVTTGTSRWIRNVNSNSAAGNGAMADKAAGGSQAITWAATNDWCGIAAVEVAATDFTVPVTRVAVTTGAPASSAAFAPTLPTHAAGDRLILLVLGKYNTATIPTINQSWVLLGSGAGGGGGAANDAGPTFWAAYGKDAASSSETAPTVTPGATTPNSWVWVCASHRPGTTWQDSITTSAAWVQSATDSNTASPLTGTAGAWTGVQPTAGDAIFAAGVIPTDIGSALGATTLTATGLSGGTVAAASSQYVENIMGQDSAAVWAGWTGFTGTASAGLVSSFTITSSTNHSGSIVAVALRQAPATVTVSATRATTWLTAAAVAGSRATTWDVDAEVTGSRATTWNVDADTTLPTLVQSVSATPASGTGSITATLPGAPAAGNFLIAACGMDKNSGTITPPSGFTTILNHTSTSVSSWVGWKISDGSETSITLTHATVSSAGDAMWYAEYANSSVTGSDWQIVASATNPTNETANLSWSTGTTGAATATGYALAFHMIDSGQSKTGGGSYTNGFSVVRAFGVSGRGDVAVGSGSINSGATAETTFSYTGTTDQMSGALVGFAKISGVTQVSATRGTSWLTAARVTGTRSTTWLASAAVVASRATTWTANAVTAGTRATTWAVKAPVTATRATTWQTAAAVASTRATTWAVKVPVTGSRATTWTASASAVSTRATTWQTRATAAATRSTLWTASAGVAATRATTWQARAAIVSTRATSWTAGSTVTGSRATTWTASGSLTATRATTWAAQTGVTASRGTTWHVDATGAVAATRASTWAVRERISATRATLWTTFAGRVRTNVAIWATLARVTATRATLWEASATTAASRGTSWTVTAPVQTARSTSWTAAQAVTGSRATSWAAKTSVTGSRATAWTAALGVTGTRSTTWQVDGQLSTVTATRSTTWGVVGRILASRATSWTVGTTAAATRGTTWQTGQQITGTRATAWTVIGPVQAVRGTIWETRSATTATRGTIWTVGTTASVQRSTTWQVRQTASATRTTGWATFAPVQTERGTTWAIGDTQSVNVSRSTTWVTYGLVAANRLTRWRVSFLLSRSTYRLDVPGSYRPDNGTDTRSTAGTYRPDNGTDLRDLTGVTFRP